MSILSEFNQFLIALNLLPRIGRQTIKSIFENQTDHASLDIFQLVCCCSQHKSISVANQSRLKEYSLQHGSLFIQVCAIRQMMSDNNILMINRWGDDYPYLLNQIDDCPVFLFIKGDVRLLKKPQIAIVGSRKASRASLKTAYEFAQQLAMNNIVVSSGLAMGVDSAAHSGVLDVDLETIAVMGTGLDRIYPVQHAHLATRILTKGAWVSEYLPGMKAIASNFPRRNRIISGLSLGTIIVEAKSKSGTLITARMAMEQNREVFAVPGPIAYQGSEGCHRLIKEGAKLVDCIDDVLEELNIEAVDYSNSNLEPINSISNDLVDILSAIDYEATSSMSVCAALKLPLNSIAGELVELELEGYIERVGDYYKRIK